VKTFLFSEGQLSRVAAIWTQQMAGTDRQFATMDAYVITDADFEPEFDMLYNSGGLIDLREAIAQAEAAGRMPYAGILKVHEAYIVGLIASYYGDIPYREAVSDIETPALDDQAQVYADLQALLDEAITDLAGAGAGPGALDLNFGGDVAAWTAVAYTLKARYHMHWAEVNGASSYTAARAAAANGITTAAGAFKARFNTAQTESNLWTQFLVDRSGYVGAGDVLPDLMTTNADPRIDAYYSADRTTLSETGYGAADFDIPLVSCAENYFIIAEAETQIGTAAAARTAANAGLDCEEASYTPPLDLSGRQTLINGLSGAALREEILNQKYIALFLNTETFNDYKRTCLPTAIIERPGGMPGRLFYSSQERRTNPNIPDTGTDPNDKYNDNDPTPCP
jgi:hypothetical protein